jgi:hypothetical protein
LHFAPWGGAGPGGELPAANWIIGAMKSAGYRVPPPAPYNGPGSTEHGSTEQLIYGLQWLNGKSRQ